MDGCWRQGSPTEIYNARLIAGSTDKFRIPWLWMGMHRCTLPPPPSRQRLSSKARLESQQSAESPTPCLPSPSRCEVRTEDGMPFALEAARSCAPPAADKSRSRTPCEDDTDETDEPSPECPPASEVSHERLWQRISLTSWWVQNSGTSHKKRCICGVPASMHWPRWDG